MIGQIISHYKIFEKLGSGGMGVVYKAQDLKLDRFIALKFLPPDLTLDSEAKERFIQEAKAASALQHHNICTIHDIDETDKGQLFICMDCYEGETLKKKLERGPMEIKKAVDIIAQAAQGLEKAHKQGIVHRDIKPANIMITDEGIVKILDFGLAKLKGQTTLTKTGVMLGTVAYMSPEQAHGETVDPRTDIWSCGVVLYEMVTGKLPFHGDYEQALIYSIMNEEPTPMKEIPGDLEGIVNKALMKRLEKRYQRVEEMAADLAELKKKMESGVLRPKVSSKKPVPSMAVLPFVDMSPQKDQEYFCDGMAEEIINALTQLENLHVIARTSSFAFKDKQEDVREIGKKLNVETLLEGSVRKAGNRLRITAQLVNVSDGFHHWSERYDRDIEDVFAIQDEIAQNIAHTFKLKLSSKEKRVLRKVATKDVQAYDFYLRGRKFLYRAGRKSVSFALEMFSKAIERDPGYARAYAGIADCSSWLFMYVASTDEKLKQAIEASRKALELDPELAEAHAARALAFSLNKKYKDSEGEFETAIQLNPKLYEAYYFYARACFVQGKLEKAARLFEQSCLVNPDDYQAPFLLANSYKGLNLVERAEKAYRRGLHVAERQMELNPDDARAFYLGAHGLIELGDHEKGFQWCNRALAIDPEDPSLLYNLACAHSLGGRTEEAVKYLEKAIEMGYSQKEWIDNDSYLDSIRRHPRFCALMKKLE